jgi:hypothetical protein
LIVPPESLVGMSKPAVSPGAAFAEVQSKVPASTFASQLR